MPGAHYGSEGQRDAVPSSHGQLGTCLLLNATHAQAIFCCALPAGTPAAPAKPSWVREECAPRWAALATHCGQLAADCRLEDAQLWGPWAVLAAPEAAFPPAVAARLNAFQQLLMVQVRGLPAG